MEDSIKIVIDSSVFVSALGINDVNSPDSRRFLNHVSQQEIILPTLVVCEVLTVLGKQGAKNLEQIWDNLKCFNLESLDQNFIARYLDLLTTKNKLKTSDLIIAATTNLHQATLITWDKQHLSSKQTLCQAISPTQFLEEQT